MPEINKEKYQRQSRDTGTSWTSCLSFSEARLLETTWCSSWNLSCDVPLWDLIHLDECRSVWLPDAEQFVAFPLEQLEGFRRNHLQTVLSLFTYVCLKFNSVDHKIYDEWLCYNHK